MDATEFKIRTKLFALRVMHLVEALPKTKSGDILGKQLLRCGTSVGANYRAACRARSQADFIAKMGIVEEEADEVQYWIDLIVESGMIKANRVKDLQNEANQILSMTVSSIKTARLSK